MPDTTETELAIIGAGPGGYAAAFLAADKGMKVTLIDAGEKPGGTCLHVGCIPSKALLHTAKLITDARDAAHFGVSFGPPKIDLAAGQLILKGYYHVGVAVDTEGGLLVPVIRDVDKKSIAELAQELTAVAESARKGKADMQGGTFTITNLGGIGGTAFTPIVNYPEVAILGLSRARLQPVIHNGEVVPRLILTLSLSYDHRVIDGADGARFTRRICEMLESPLRMLLDA